MGLASTLVNKKRFVIGGIWRFEFQTTLMVKIDSSLRHYIFLQKLLPILATDPTSEFIRKESQESPDQLGNFKFFV